MAEKTKSGGGGFTWLISGFLLGVIATLAMLAFLARDPETPVQAQSAIVAPPVSQPVAPGAAQPAAPVLAGSPTGTDAPPAPTSSAAPSPTIAPDSENLDPDDAASAGMTSRAPSQ
ncbi:hypothetical protein QO010_001175 [Caulobacter ginsengisoli]|uniref:Sporulation protein n=1 Tax=Caulobacter ginsengisoli TaxID=400775 RepID=A0ABU0IN23_9CAUL|nr:hypothetical protein [Caulobacter ginsengisoli]MDQ0463404.1 hypothetical protein [Caulobacter ginsengisoli]